MRQGEDSIMVYACHLKAIWREIDHFWPVANPQSVERGYALKQRLFTFLMGLNPMYEGVLVPILNREKIPDLENAIGMIADEELQMNMDNDMKIGVESQKLLQVAFVARKSDGRSNPKSIAHPSLSSSNVKLEGSHQIIILEIKCFAIIARRSDTQKTLARS